MVHLRQRLAKFIKEKRGDLTQRAFARKIGVAQSTIMRIENLEQNVTLKTLENICRFYHVDIAELFPRMDAAKDYAPRVRSGLTMPAPRSAALLHEKTTASEPQGKPPKKPKAKR